MSRDQYVMADPEYTAWLVERWKRHKRRQNQEASMGFFDRIKDTLRLFFTFPTVRNVTSDVKGVAKDHVRARADEQVVDLAFDDMARELKGLRIKPGERDKLSRALGRLRTTVKYLYGSRP